MQKKLSYKLLNKVCQNCKDQYCTLKEFFHICALIDPRFFVQLKCIEIYKYDLGKKENKDIGWEQATLLWTDNRYAEIFAEIYNQEIQLIDEPDPIIVYEKIKERLKINENQV